MSEPVRARRAALIAGLLVASYVVVTFAIRTVPDRVVTLLGGPDGGIDRIGGLRVHYRPVPGAEAAFATYLASRGSVRREGDALVLEFPGVTEDAVPELTDLVAGGGLVMKEVVETDHAVQIGASEDAEIDTDEWQLESDSQLHKASYLRAYTAEAMQRALDAAAARGWALPDGRELGFEWVEPYPDDGDPRPYLRTYELASEVLVDSSMIASATQSFDPNTNRPIVLLDFTRAGADRFCALTERLAGKKLATILGGQVRSAPLVMGPICGGRASIAMGGSDVARQAREAAALVVVLGQGALPAGGIIERQSWAPPANVTRQEWAGRLLLGAIAGLGFGLVVWLVLAFARPSRRPTLSSVAGPFPWRRAAVTLLAPVTLILGAKLTLPGLDVAALAHVVRGSSGATESVIALGLTPVLVAFFVVELVALAVPPLRWRRHDPLARVRLGQAVAALAIAFALVQGFFTATYLESIGRSPLFAALLDAGSSGAGMPVVDQAGWQFRLVVMGSLAAGTLLLAVIAGIIREHGLGNGYAVVLASGGLIEIVAPYLAEDVRLREVLGRGHLLGVVGLAAIAAGTACVLRWQVAVRAREVPLRLPVSGFVPLHQTASLMFLLVTLAAVGGGTGLERAMVWGAELGARPWLTLGFAVLSVPLWAWLFARPSLVTRTALQAGLERPSHGAWSRATLVTGCLLASAAVLWMFAAGTDVTAANLMEPAFVMLATAVVLDVAADARAHRGPLVPAAVLHQLQYAGIAERVLGDAGIPCHLHASHVRALLAFFGPFAPVIVMVPAEHGEAARTRLDDALRAARGSLPPAQAREAAPD